MKIRNTFTYNLNFTILTGGMPRKVSLAPNAEISLLSYGADRQLMTGATTTSGLTLTKTDALTPTLYTFVLTANTIMANQTATAITVGNITYVGFSGATSAMMRTGLTASTTFSALGITPTGGNGTLISNSTFFLSAYTSTAGLKMADVPKLFDNVSPSSVKIIMNPRIVRKVLMNIQNGTTFTNWTNPFRL